MFDFCLNSPGKNTGVGNHSLLQRIFLTHQGSKPVSLALLAYSLASEPQDKPFSDIT